MALPHHRYTFKEYLEVEEFDRIKHEYFEGAIYAMPGATPEHAALSAGVTAMLGDQLRGSDCRVFSSDLRVLLATGLATYPDVTVVCGPLDRHSDSPTHFVNPTVVVEVTSDGTESYDRGAKLDHYRRTPSLESVVLVSHRERRIEVWTRGASEWSVEASVSGESADVPVAGRACTLGVDALYDAAGA